MTNQKIDILQLDKNAIPEDFSSELSNLLDIARKRYSFQQFGRKSGQYYIEHAVNGIFNLMQFREVFEIISPDNADNLQKICILSYLIHDINKILDYKDMYSSQKWSQETIQSELEKLNKNNAVNSFFPMWKDYKNDITEIINGHSTIYHHQSRNLVMNEYEPYDSKLALHITKRELEGCIKIVQVVDLMDLLFSLDEDEKITMQIMNEKMEWGEEKQYDQNRIYENIRIRLSSFYGELAFQSIRIISPQGTLSQVLCNYGIDVLIKLGKKKKIGIIPLLVFPDGFLFAVRASDIDKIDDAFRNEFYKHVGKELSNLYRKRTKISHDDWKNFYRKAPEGIKFKNSVLKDPDKIEVMLDKVMDHKIRAKKSRENHLSGFTAIKNGNWTKINEKSFKHKLVSVMFEGDKPKAELIGKTGDEVWEITQYIQGIYYNLKRYYKLILGKKKSPAEVMKMITDALSITKEFQSFLDLEQPSSFYTYSVCSTIIGRYLALDAQKRLTEVQPLLKNMFLDVIKDNPVEVEIIPHADEIVKRIITLSGGQTTSSELIEHKKSTKICCSCGLAHSNNEDWKSQFIPYMSEGGSKTFSNTRKACGARGYRRVCEICKQRYFLERLLFPIHSTDRKVFFLSFTPRHGVPLIYIKQFRNVLGKMKDETHQVFNIQPHKYFNNIAAIEKGEIYKLIYNKQKGHGNTIFKMSEEVGGTYHTKRDAGEGKMMDQYWESMMNVVAISFSFRFNGMMMGIQSDFHNVISHNDMLYFHDIPKDLDWITKGNDRITVKQLDSFVNIISLIYEIIGKLDLKRVKDITPTIIQFLRSLKRGKLEAIHYLEKRIRSNVEAKYRNSKRRKADNLLENLYKLHSQL